jgi:hypothetical protein
MERIAESFTESVRQARKPRMMLSRCKVGAVDWI